MKKKIVALLLTAAMGMSLLAGCGGTEESAAGNEAATEAAAEEAPAEEAAAEEEAPAEEAAVEEEAPAEEAAVEEEAPAEEAAAEEEAPAEEAEATEEAAPVGDIDFDDDPEELKVALMSLAPIPSDITDRVEEKLNEISLAKINATVDYQWFDGGSYITQVPMMLQGGEQLDLIMFTPIPAAGYQSFMNQKQLCDISDSLEEYGQGILKYMRPDENTNYLEATSRNGGIYGVGVLQDMSQTCAFDLRGDMLEESGFTADDIANAKSFDDIKAITEKVIADHPGINGFVNLDTQGTVLQPQPYVIGDGNFDNVEWLDVGGDSYQYIYVDPADNKVKCFFEHEKWQQGIKLVRDWYEAGLIYKDAQTAQDYGINLVKNDVGFGMIHGVEMGNQALVESQTGSPDVQRDIAACKINTASFTKFGMCVPVSTVDQDRAVALLNLIWDDPEYRDTLSWGVEGVDWERTDKGTATYPEGMSDQNAYHTADFLYGNRLETIPWDSDDADTLRERQKAANAELEISPFFGFAVDGESIADTIAAVKNVVDTYYPPLSAGTVEDVDGQLETFVNELYGAGMQTILDTYQAQLDEWLANK